MTTIQEKLLNMLIDIDRVARGNGVDYAISGGTLLGAVREKGFIPWDDDIDIDVEFDKFEDFMDLMEEKLPRNYAVVRYSKYNTRFHYGQIVNTDIKIKRSFNDNKKIPTGLAIDVFNIFMTKKKSPYLKWLLILKWSRNYVDHRQIVNFIKLPLKIIPLKYLNWRIDRKIKKLRKGGDKFSTTQAFNFSPTKYKIHKKRQDIEFEGKMFKTFFDYKDYLLCHFGEDYMTPDVKQVSHNFEIDNENR